MTEFKKRNTLQKYPQTCRPQQEFTDSPRSSRRSAALKSSSGVSSQPGRSVEPEHLSAWLFYVVLRASVWSLDYAWWGKIVCIFVKLQTIFFLLIKEILKINFELFIKIKKQQTNTLFAVVLKKLQILLIFHMLFNRTPVMGTKIYPSVNHHVITVVELNEQSNMNIFHCRLLSVSKHFVPWVSDTCQSEVRTLQKPDWLQSSPVISLVKLCSSCRVATVSKGWREDWP